MYRGRRGLRAGRLPRNVRGKREQKTGVSGPGRGSWRTAAHISGFSTLLHVRTTAVAENCPQRC